jgi:hypothetical protein
MFFVRTQREYI